MDISILTKEIFSVLNFLNIAHKGTVVNINKETI